MVTMWIIKSTEDNLARIPAHGEFKTNDVTYLKRRATLLGNWGLMILIGIC